MSFGIEEFISYTKSKGLKCGKAYSRSLKRIERQYKTDIDTEYRNNGCALISEMLNCDFRESKTDKRLHNAVKQLRCALKKYICFCRDVKAASDLLPKTDWSLKDTMVGTVRSGAQLDFILKYSGYYVPAYFITEDRLPIKYIALHEQGIGSDPGIGRYGEVLGTQIIKRSRIPVPMSRGNGDEPYYYFKVRCWQKLPRTIEIRDTHRGQPLFTNKFLLDNCTQSYQLFSVSSDKDYLLMTAINKAFEDMRDSGAKDFSSVYPINKAYTLTLSESQFTVVNEKNEALESISVGSFLYRPRDEFERLKKVIMK